MRAVRPRLCAKARGRYAKASTKGAGEVRRLPIAHEPRDVAHSDRGLFRQELRRDGHAPRAQVLLKARLTELGIRAL